jgi:hypothetical protein
MAEHRGFRRAVLTTPAEAKVKEIELGHEERMYDRRRSEERDREEKEDRRRAAEEKEKLSFLELQERRHERELRERDDRLRALENKPSESQNALSGAASLLQTIMPQRNSDRDLTMMAEQHRNELARLETVHQNNIMHLQQQITAERDRNERDRKDVEERAARRIEEIERRAERQVEDLRRQHEREVQHMKESHELRISDERRQHERDMMTHNNMGNMTSTTLKQTYEMQIASKNDELARFRIENDGLRRELEGEKRRSLADRLNEFSAAAEAAGYVKESDIEQPETSDDWKTLLAKGALSVAPQLPNLLASAAQVARGGVPQQAVAGLPPGVTPEMAARMAQGAPQQMQPRQHPHAQRPRRAPVQRPFATEDGDDFNTFESAPSKREPVVVQVPQPVAQPPAQPAAYAPPAAPAQPPVEMHPTTQADAQQVATPAQAAEALRQMEQMPQISDAEIIGTADYVRNAIASEQTPEQFVHGAVMTLSADQARMIPKVLKLDRIYALLEAQEGADNDPLLRRDGQKYIEQVWDLLDNLPPS